ncbi:MAG TPA: hypothetical protein VKZ18_05455 [Polyangia bacterium]|nr:hypothetical protein [Polyangia bacterium]
MLQASEGGSFSVGKRKFKIKASVTPAPTPLSSATRFDGTPVAMPASTPTERISRVSPLRLSTLAPATDKMVVSKSALVGFCLTAFAAGVVITLAVDRVHARAESPHDAEPIVLQTTSLQEPARPAPAAAPAIAPAPAAAADDAVVVQLPAASEKPALPVAPAPRAALPAAAAPVHPVAAAPVRQAAPAAPVRQVVAAPVRTSAQHATAPQKKAAALPETDPTEAAPDPAADTALPAPVKKKWVDPFEP